MRERDVIREMPRDLIFETKALPVGDIWILGAIDESVLEVSSADISGTRIPKGLILERKTIADMQASIKDGRWREQKSRLLTQCSQENMRAAYIIEGSFQFVSGSIGVNAIRKLLNRLQFRYNIPVLLSDDICDTIGVIKNVYEQYLADAEAFAAPTEAKQYYESVSVSKKANKEDPDNFARTVLMQCPGISATIADAIMREAGPRLSDVFAKDEKTLASISVTEKRKVGPAVAKRLLALWNRTL